MNELKEGDIYRWRYREPGDDRQYGRYHCCSCIAIVSRGMLRDTFWMIGNSFPGSDGKAFGPDRLHELELTRVANLSELDKASEYEADYYDDSDIVNLNHSNSTRGNFYLRKGAKRSTAKMLEVARQKLLQEQSNQRLASLRSFDLRHSIAQIEAGETAVLL